MKARGDFLTSYTIIAPFEKPDAKKLVTLKEKLVIESIIASMKAMSSVQVHHEHGPQTWHERLAQ